MNNNIKNTTNNVVALEGAPNDRATEAYKLAFVLQIVSRTFNQVTSYNVQPCQDNVYQLHPDLKYLTSWT